MQAITEEPHHAGSPGSRKVAEYVLGKFKSWGLDASIEQFEALMPYPTERVARARRAGRVRRGAEGAGGRPSRTPDSTTGAAADVQRLLRRRRRHRRPRLRELRHPRGLRAAREARRRRQGQDRDRALRPELARHQAEGRVRSTARSAASSTPIRATTGTSRATCIRDGPYRPEQGVQRGSVMDMPIYPGDPLTPGMGVGAGRAASWIARRRRRMLKIPVLPISYGDALPLLRNLKGPVAPEAVARRAADHVSRRRRARRRCT